MRPRLLSCLMAPMLFLAVSVGAADAAQTTLTIKGMTCGGCVAAVKVQLGRTAGVNTYEVSLEKGEAQVAYDPARTDPQKIAESVSKSGFQTTVKAETRKGAGPTSDGSMPALEALGLDPSRCSREVLARFARRS